MHTMIQRVKCPVSKCQKGLNTKYPNFVQEIQFNSIQYFIFPIIKHKECNIHVRACAPVKEEFNYKVNYSSECFTIRWDFKKAGRIQLVSQGPIYKSIQVASDAIMYGMSFCCFLERKDRYYDLAPKILTTYGLYSSTIRSIVSLGHFTIRSVVQITGVMFEDNPFCLTDANHGSSMFLPNKNTQLCPFTPCVGIYLLSC